MLFWNIRQTSEFKRGIEMNVKTAYICNRGGREDNDDTVRIHQNADHAHIFVGDGLGGYSGGKQASEAAAEAVLHCGRRSSMLNEEVLTSAASAAADAVMALQQSTGGDMKTTLVFLAIEGAQARWMHIGDSRLYHFANGYFQQQTADHSVSQMAVIMGEIAPKDIRFHPDRNRVVRALGAANCQPEVSPAMMVTAGSDVFLLCTDGFWEYVYEEEMEKTLQESKTPEQWLGKMERILLSRASINHDNYTAAAVFC